MDALFGLPRKKSAGVSYRDPLMGELFCFDQTEVDQFIALSGNSKSKKKEIVCFEYLIVVLHERGCIHDCSNISHLRIVTAVILLLEAPSVVLAGTQHLMRQPCLATVVDMNFWEDSSTLNMANGKM